MANLAPAPTALLRQANLNHGGYRHKRKRPMLKRWQKFLLGWLHSRSPTFTRYTNFRPETLVGWHRRFVKRWWWMLVAAGKRRSAGRPRVDASVEKIIICTANPGCLPL